MGSFVFFLSAALLVPVAWYGTDPVAHVFFGINQYELSTFLGVVAALLIAGFLGKAAAFASDAPASGWARKSVGWFYRLLVAGPVLGLALWLLWPVYVWIAGAAFPLSEMVGFVVVAAALGAVLHFAVPWLKHRVALLLKPLHDLVRTGYFGTGGSAAFGGIIEDWAARYRPGAILLGASLYDRPWRVGHYDDRGMLTIASSRSGKGRSAIIPNLICWPDSALVIDPKGTNAAVTAARRRALGQTVFVVDPFGITPFGDDELSRYNPLASIDFKSNQVTEDIRQIADALVVSDGEKESHWSDAARTIISGLIAHLLASGKGHSLSDVRQAMKQGNEALDALFGEMLDDHSAGGLPAAAAALVTNAGPNERGSFYTTVARNLDWLDSVAMQKTLGKTDFNLADLKRKPMTVYVVLPPDMLSQHKRFMRLFVNSAINGIAQGERGRHKVLFLLDEFYSLGNLALIEKASGLLSGYGMKLWPIVQNISQLHDLYPKNWETFFANAGAVQVFSVNDRATADYLTAALGKRVVHRFYAGRDVQRTVEALRELEEFGRDVSREKLRQIIYRNGADPLVLRRLQYDQDFPASSFAPDPDYARPAKRPRSDRLAVASWLRGAWAGLSFPKLSFGGSSEAAALLPPPPTKLPPPAQETVSEPEEPPKKAVPLDPPTAKGVKLADDYMARFQASLKARPLGPPAPPKAESPPAELEKPAKPEGEAGLSFEALLAAPVASSKAAIFERYELLKKKAGGDEALLSRATIWLTGDYRKNLTGPDPFAAEDDEEEQEAPPPKREKGNPWADRKRGDGK